MCKDLTKPTFPSTADKLDENRHTQARVPFYAAACLFTTDWSRLEPAGRWCNGVRFLWHSARACCRRTDAQQASFRAELSSYPTISETLNRPPKRVRCHSLSSTSLLEPVMDGPWISCKPLAPNQRVLLPMDCAVSHLLIPDLVYRSVQYKDTFSTTLSQHMRVLPMALTSLQHLEPLHLRSRAPTSALSDLLEHTNRPLR
jgi:hypothetical protein